MSSPDTDQALAYPSTRAPNGHRRRHSRRRIVTAQDLYERPRAGVKLRTPAGSLIKVDKVDGWYDNEHLGSVLIAHGTVVEAPDCPQYKGDEVTFAVDADYAISLVTEA